MEIVHSRNALQETQGKDLGRMKFRWKSLFVKKKMKSTKNGKFILFKEIHLEDDCALYPGHSLCVPKDSHALEVQ